MTLHYLRVCTVLMLANLAIPAWAQLHDTGAVSGTGAVVISRAPEVMRLQVTITSKGATLKDALAAIKKRSDTARLQLATLGVEKGSVQIAAARIAPQDANRRNAMEAMLSQQMQRGGKAAAKAKVTPPVVVTSSLTAEWKLTAKDAEALILEVHSLQEKIRAADLAGTAEKEKLTPEQEEILEELQSSNMNRFGSNDESQTGQLVFLFVSPITDAEYDQALSEAFEKARVQAARLAKAAKAELGTLRNLVSHPDSSGGFDEYSGGYDSQAYQLMQFASRAMRGQTAEKLEALGIDPIEVKFSVGVNVLFDLKPAP